MKLKYQIAIVGISVLFILAIALIRYRRAPKLITAFFEGEAPPINLAVFRIFFFTALAFSFSVSNVEWFSSLPTELRFPPPGLQWLSTYLPINEAFAWTASVLLLFFCFTAAIGLFTRTSALACLVLGVYVLGIPQFYGKINHNHHLLWFTAILALSPCADVLSLDAIRSAWFRADSGLTDPPGPAQSYALPLRFIWLTMGAIYFSAGFWKVWTGGYRWAFSDNPRNMMYNKWMEFGVWRPFFRVDQHPILYQMSAAATILFELSFIVIIFFPAIRFLAVLAGLGFHNMTNLILRIPFWELQVCYVTFVDWRRLFRFLGRRLFVEEMFLIYDGKCGICRRAIGSLRTFDALERVTYLDAFDEGVLNEHGLDRLKRDDLLADIHAIKRSRISRGFDAYRAVALRFPILWPLLPLLYIPPLSLIGRAVYRHTADSRSCDISPTQSLNLAVKKGRASTRAVALISCFVLYGVVITAIGKINSWPFAGYPTFEDIDEPEVTVIRMQAITPTGIRDIDPFAEDSGQQMSHDRMMAMFGRILSIDSESERRSRLQALWRFWNKDRPDLQGVVAVRFYRDTLSSLPERQNDNLIRRQFLYELRLSN